MTIYNPSGGIIIDAPITKEAVEKFVLMGDWYVLLPFMSLSVLDIPEGSYINYKGKKWEIMAPVYPESSGTGYSYSLQFDDQQNKLKKSICFWLGGPNPEAVFSDTTDLTSFGNLIVANMNRELGSEIWEFGGLVNVDNQETVKVVSFSGDTCWDAVNNIANAFDCEWWTEQNGGKVYLFFGKLERGSDEIFKEGDVISQMPARKSNNDDGYGTRFYVFGSTRNLTSDYGQADQGGATNHVSEIRLRLPNNQQYIDARPDLTPSEVTPVVVFFDYVYPKNTDTVTSVEEKTITPEEGDPYPAYVVYAGATPFVPSDVIEGETLQAQFTSGDLTSLTFKVSINYDSNTWTPEDGFDKKFEIVAQIETSGDSVSIIPNANMKPKSGDTFVLTGVKLPKQRIAEAEQELLEEGTAYAEKHSGDTNVYDCPTNPVYCAANDKSYDAGQVVILQDARFGTDGRRSRIQGYEKKLYNEYVATYTVGDNRTYSRTGKIENDVKQNIYSQRIGTTTSGAAVYLITRYDQTPATDYNAYSALRALWQFANKQTDETFKGNVSFEKDIRSSDFKKGDIAGAGYAAYKDENGDAVIEADKIVIRKEARFNQAVINQVTFQRGSTVMTLAGCKITAVEETDSAYRCHYDNKQGSQFSGFVVQDQARCQRYDATQSVIAKYYWRLVVGVGNDYVDLSKSDVDGSGIPAIGDEIVQFGNRIDATRQRAIVLDPLNGSVEVYAHIDSYSLLNRGFVGMGIDPQSQEAYIYSYGDLLAGDRDPLAEDAEYIRFTKDEGEARRTLKIQAQMSIKAGSSGLANLTEWAEQQEKIDAMGYITEALKGSTTISGGLILTSLISLLDQDGTTKSGINGIYDPEKLGGGIAAWYGGEMADKFDYYYWDETDWTLKPKPDVEIPESIAQGVDRMDGTGYRAGGNFWWDADGNIYADPLSFFVGEETVGNVLALFRFNYKPDSIDKPFEDVLSVTPMRKFTELQIGEAIIEWDDTNNALVFRTADRSGYVGFYGEYTSALGLNPDTGGGGGGGATALSELSDVQLSGLLAGDVLIYDGTHWVNRPQSSIVPDLSEYATRTWVQQQGYATSAALTAHAGDAVIHISSAERTLWNRTATDFAAIVGADSDQIINKWEEVVAFLDTYTEADTLANLLSNKVDKVTGYGLSKNDFTDALLSKLNGIEAGANRYVHPTGGADAAIDDAAGRVLAGITVNALGHVTSVASKTLAAADIPTLSISKVSGLQDALDGKLDAATFDDLFEKVNIGTTSAPKYAIRAKYGLYADGFLSSLGLNSSGGGGTGGGSYDRLDLWGDYASERAGWVLSAGLGYDLYNRVRSLEGGSALSFTTEGTGNVVTAVKKSGTAVVVTKGLTALTSHQPIYALNFQAGAFEAKKYTPNTGAQTVNIPTKVSHLSNDSGFISSSALTGYATQSWVKGLGYITASALTPYITAATANATFATKLGVSGNQIGTYVGGKLGNLITVPYATNADTVDGLHKSSLGQTFYNIALDANDYKNLPYLYAGKLFNATNVPYTYYPFLHFGGGDIYAQFSAYGNMLKFRASRESDYTPEWRTVAFTDSNVSSATKLQTARTLWGQPFDGSQNIGGDFKMDKDSDGRRVRIAKETARIYYTAGTAAWAEGLLLQDNAESSNLSNLGFYGIGDTLLYIFLGGTYISPKMVIDASGNVGIGTSSPAYKLDVAGAVHATTGFITETDVRLNNRIYFKGTDHYIEVDANGLFHFSHGVYTDGTLAARGFNNSGSTISLWGNTYDGKNSIDGVIRSIYAADPTDGTIIGKFLAKKSDPLGLILRTYTNGSVSLQSQRENDNLKRFVLALNPLGGNVAINQTSASYTLDVAGTIKASVDIIATGTVTAKDFIKPSDARLKTYMEEIELSVQDVANAPAWRYKWKSDESMDVGSTTQYWGAIVPELTHKLPDGKYYGLDYGKTALLSAIAVARTVQSHEERIAELERENEQLKQTLKKYM